MATDRPQNIVQLTRALAKISTPKVPLWRFNLNSTLQQVFNPTVGGTKEKINKELALRLEQAKINKKKRNKFISYKEEVIEVKDNSVYGKIRVACTCTPENRTSEMLVLLDSVATTLFFSSFHCTWRREMLRRIELVELSEGFTLFKQNDKAECAYFLLSGRLSNEVLIGNKVTELLVETSAPTSMFKSHSKRQEEEDRKKQNNQESNQYITMPTLYPGSEIHVDCLRPSHVGKKTRTKRDRTVKALDNVFLFRLTKEGFDEGSAEQDFNEDFHIWKFFQDKSAGGLGQKVFSKFTQQMENEWKSLWHLETFESGSLLTKQGERALKVFVCSHGTLEVIRRTENNQLLVIDRPRIGEFVCSGASALIKSVQKTIPVYKTLAQTSLIAKTATDCFVASADAFYNFCYQYKWVGNFLHDYFSVLGLNDIQAKTSMFNQSEWNLQKKKIVNSNIDKTLFRLNAKGMQTGTFAKDPVLLRKQQTGPKIFRKKKVHHIKPIAVAVLNQIVDDIPKKKNKKKKKKKKENKLLTPSFQTSKKILETSHSIYALLEKNRKSTKKSSKNTSKSKSKSLPMLPKVKERLKQRYEASMQLHKKRYGSHRLIRGSDLRWYVKGT